MFETFKSLKTHWSTKQLKKCSEKNVPIVNISGEYFTFSWWMQSSFLPIASFLEDWRVHSRVFKWLLFYSPLPCYGASICSVDFALNGENQIIISQKYVDRRRQWLNQTTGRWQVMCVFPGSWLEFINKGIWKQEIFRV